MERVNYRGSIRARLDATNLFRADGGLFRDHSVPLTDVERLMEITAAEAAMEDAALELELQELQELELEEELEEERMAEVETNPFDDGALQEGPASLLDYIVPSTQWVELSSVSMTQSVDLHLPGGKKKAGQTLSLSGSVHTHSGLGSGTLRLGYERQGFGRRRVEESSTTCVPTFLPFHQLCVFRTQYDYMLHRFLHTVLYCILYTTQRTQQRQRWRQRRRRRWCTSSTR